MTSEELLMEKIQKEKEEMKKLKEINMINMEKSKNFINKPLPPTPLTILKPFNLSSNNSKMLMKKRITNNNNEFIRNNNHDSMKKKSDEKINKENISAKCNKFELNKTPNKKNFLNLNFDKSASKSPLKKFSYNKNNFNNLNSFGNGNNNLQLDEENTINYLSSRFENNCFISNHKNKFIAKSPLTRTFENKENNYKNNNNLFNKENEKDFDNDNFINYTGESELNEFEFERNNLPYLNSLTIRRNFPFDKKPMKSFDFGINNIKSQNNNNNNNNNNNEEFEDFSKVMEKSRQDKFLMDNIEKERIKKEKIDQIKKLRFSTNNANMKPNNLSIKERKSNLINKDRQKLCNNKRNKIVSFDELMSEN